MAKEPDEFGRFGLWVIWGMMMMIAVILMAVTSSVYQRWTETTCVIESVSQQPHFVKVEYLIEVDGRFYECEILPMSTSLRTDQRVSCWWREGSTCHSKNFEKPADDWIAALVFFGVVVFIGIVGCGVCQCQDRAYKQAEQQEQSEVV